MRSDEELWNALSKLRGDEQSSLTHLRESVRQTLKELGQEKALDRVLSEATCAMGGVLGAILATQALTRFSHDSQASPGAQPCELFVRVPQEAIEEVRISWSTLCQRVEERLGFHYPGARVEAARIGWELRFRNRRLHFGDWNEDWKEEIYGTLLSQARHLFTFEYLTAWILQLTHRHERLMKEVMEQELSLVTIYYVLLSLLEERVSIRDLDLVLTSLLLNWSRCGQDLQRVVETVRKDLGSLTYEPYEDRPGHIQVVRCSSKLESWLESWLENSVKIEATPGSEKLRVFLFCLGEYAEKGRGPFVLLTTPKLRRLLWDLLSENGIEATVLSTREIPASVEVETVHTLSLSGEVSTGFIPRPVLNYQASKAKF